MTANAILNILSLLVLRNHAAYSQLQNSCHCARIITELRNVEIICLHNLLSFDYYLLEVGI